MVGVVLGRGTLRPVKGIGIPRPVVPIAPGGMWSLGVV